MRRLVEVRVREVERTGLKVDILGGKSTRVGVIRHQEMSWDRSVNAIPPTFKTGQTLKAKIIRDRRKDPYAYLSLRQLSDPWEGAEKKYCLGQVVRGEVVSVRQVGVFVQIEPGIDAIIWPRDIPLLRDQPLKEVLTVGDQVQGVITKIDWEKRAIAISLTERLQELSLLSAEERRSIQLKLSKDSPPSIKTGRTPHGTDALDGHNRIQRTRYRPPISKLERLLVIDDTKADLRKICQYLRNAFGVEVDGVLSGQEALKKIKAEQPYSLLVIDLMLEGEHIAEVVEGLLSERPELAVVFASANPLAEKEIPTIYGRKFPFAYKEPEEIAEQIDKLCNGYWEEIDESHDTAYVGSGSFADQLGMAAFARHSLPEVLQQMLTRLRLETQTSQVMVLEVDTTDKTVSIIAAAPLLEENVERVILDGLYYSPVQDVVEYEEEFYETDIVQRRYPRFRKFFPVLPFQAFLGIPLTIPGLVTRHALFLFDESRPEFELEDLDNARLAAKFIQVALERALLLDYMQRYEQRYSLGQLLGNLVHEAYVKIDALGTRIETLPTLLKGMSASGDTVAQSKCLADAELVVEGLTQTKEDLEELTRAYSRMAKGDLEGVNVNTVVRKVILQLENRTRGANVTVHFDEQSDLPEVRAIPSRVEQIVLNLFLNAIQQIDEQRRVMSQIAHQRGEKVAVLQQGQIIVQTRCRDAQALWPVEIIVTDTGPGIHYNQQEEIFQLDTTTRAEGHGLGLFISKNTAETLGGRLGLADSLMFIGSSFVLELPSSAENGG